MSEKKVRKIYRICPCDLCNAEAIRSWLEDMADKGLFLTKNGEFCGVFTFERGTPQKVRYRLDIAKKQKTRFFSNGSKQNEEEKEVYRSMGWEYLFQYGEFRIYRTADCYAPELNTDSQTIAVSIGILKNKQRKLLVSVVIISLLLLLAPQLGLIYFCFIAVNFGAVYTLGIYGALLYKISEPLIRLFRIKRYEKRLLAGDSLIRHCNWKKSAPFNYCIRVLSILLCCGIVVGLSFTAIGAGTEFPLEEYPGKPPFATLADTFPDGVITKANAWLDYGTASIWENSVSTNIEWNESCDISTADGEKYHCVLRVDYHETATEWIARGLEEDYYAYDPVRNLCKRFEYIDVPDLGVDSVRVYSIYDSLYVLMREGNRVVHAVVVLDDHTDQNQWLLWAKVMADMLR